MADRPVRFSASGLLTLTTIVLLAVAAGVAVAVVRHSMRQHTLKEAEAKSRILLDRNLATHTYFSHDLRPKVMPMARAVHGEDHFEPGLMSSTYAVRKMDHYFRELNASRYSYKECAIDARSPQNEADRVESAFLRELAEDPDLEIRSQVRVIDGRPYWVTLRRGEVMEDTCMRCHTKPELAPKGLLDRYGSTRSFGRKTGDVVSAISTRVPLADAYASARGTEWRLSGVFVAVLVLVLLTQFAVLRRLVFRPLGQIRQWAALIAEDATHLDEHVPEPRTRELRELASAFGLMSERLRQERYRLEEMVQQRTAELTEANERLRQEVEERREAEEAARASEQLYRRLFESLNEGFALHEIICDDQGEPCDCRILEVNPAYEALTGLRRDDIVGKTLLKAFPRTEPYWIKHYGKVALTGESIQFEQYHGELDRHYSVTVFCPQPGQFGAVFFDVTETRSAARAIEQSERRYRELFGSMSSGVAVYEAVGDGEDFLIRDMNAAGLAISRVALEDVLGRSVQSAFPGVGSLGLFEVFQRVWRTGQPERRPAAEYADERMATWVDNYVYKLPSGEIVAVYDDMTERQRALEELQTSEAKARANEALLNFALEQMPIPVIMTDSPDLATAHLNGAAIDLLGRDAEDTKELSLEARWDRLRIFKPDGTPFPFDEQPLVRAIQHGEETRGVEMVFHRLGEQRWVSASAAPLRDEEGQIIAGIAVGFDITERREAEAHRLELEAKVQQAQKLESLGVLAGGIAHDFNNLLTGVMGHADFALRAMSPLAPAREDIAAIVKASERAADLCRQMLAYSGKGRFVVEVISIDEVVEEMSSLLHVSVAKTAILRFDLAPDLPPVEADVTQIRQIVMNLITNASEAIGDRTGTITISTGATECDRAYLDETKTDVELPEGLYVYLEVSDTGCGMDLETQRRVFDPFFTTKFTGRGLGMAAVLGIVRGHQGAIRVRSEPGKGTTFKVLLPASKGEPQPSAGAPSDIQVWRGSGTVLLADDDENVRCLGQRVLEHAGFQVLTAEHGGEAVEAFREHADEIVCVLLDLTMPVMGGEDALRELRRIRTDVPVVLASGYNEDEVLSQFAGKGLSGFVQKPYVVQQLLSVLRRALTEGAGEHGDE